MALFLSFAANLSQRCMHEVVFSPIFCCLKRAVSKFKHFNKESQVLACLKISPLKERGSLQQGYKS